jgi:hypothetical protein
LVWHERKVSRERGDRILRGELTVLLRGRDRGKLCIASYLKLPLVKRMRALGM